VGFLWAVPGIIAFLIAALLGFAAVLDVPGFVGTGVFDPAIPQQLNNHFGSTAWPGSLRVLCYVLTYTGMFFAAALLMAARRGGGGWHMLRVPIGIAVFLWGQSMLGAALFSQYGPSGGWMQVRQTVGRLLPDPFLKRAIEGTRPEVAIFALVLLCIGVMALLWRPGERPIQPALLPKEGV
jgi:hypothetical protein